MKKNDKVRTWIRAKSLETVGWAKIAMFFVNVLDEIR